MKKNTIILEWRAGTLTATLINYLMLIVVVRASAEVAFLVAIKCINNFTTTRISCELCVDPDPDLESALRAGMGQVVCPPLPPVQVPYVICTYVIHGDRVGFGQRHDCGCQSTNPFRDIRSEGPGLCSLKDCAYFTYYLSVEN